MYKTLQEQFLTNEESKEEVSVSNHKTLRVELALKKAGGELN
jgi:hypothetical protein